MFAGNPQAAEMVSFRRRGRREEEKGGREGEKRGRKGEKLWQMMSTVWCMLQSEVSSDCTIVVLLMPQPLLVLKQRRLEASN